jgi:hypothetical protein
MWELDPTRFDPAESAEVTYRALAEQMRRKVRVSRGVVILSDVRGDLPG